MKKYGLIGKKLGHSYSALIHKEFGYSYDMLELPPEKLQEFVKNARLDGFNVTIPYKKEIMQYLDYIDEVALSIDAVNTVKYVDGKSYGYNTDIYGMDYALASKGISLANKKVLILGSGGTAHTAFYLAKSKNARQIIMVSRQGDVNYDNLSTHYDSQVIMNTTPVGMYPDNGERLVDIDKFANLESVFDAIYNPLLTPLLLDAKKRGIKYASGLRMLVWQAKFSRDIFVGERIDNAYAEKIYKKLYHNTINLVLIGMPSSGKTTIGIELAKATGKKFVDIDSEIEKLSGMSIAEIFEKQGEDVFRKWESEALQKFGKRNNQIIATGGGAVKDKNAYNSLKQNGLIIFLIRDLAKAQTMGRPLLSKDAQTTLKRMHQERLPIYQSFADITVNNDGEIATTLTFIKEKLYESIGD